MAHKSDSLQFHFLLGFERSGTTLLSQMLNAHPNVISPPENLLLLQFYEHFKHKTAWNEKDIDYLVKHILWEGMKSMHLWGITQQDLKAALYPLLPKTNYATVVKTIYTQYANARNKKGLMMVVDKNNPFAYHFEQLQVIFPQAKFIFLVRDYRGVFLSRKQKKVFYQSQNPYISALLWKMINKKIYNYLEDKLIVGYEELVANPKKELSKICAYLNIPYQNEMLDYQQNLDEMLAYSQNEKTRKMMEFIGSSLFKPIDKNLINKWQNELSEIEIKTLDTVCQPFAKHLGYETFYDLKGYQPQKSVTNLLHFNLVFRPLMKYQFSKIFTTGLLKGFIHK